MIRHIHYHKLKSIFNRIVWKLLFSRKFKEYGRKVNIFFPDYVVGDEYISIKDDVYIGYNASIIVLNEGQKKPHLEIGKGSKIRRFFHVVCIEEVILGKSVLIADKVMITDNVHGFSDVQSPIISQPLESVGCVQIGDGSCIGENVCIIGASIGRNCTIGANSVVVSDIPDYSIAVGAPAKVIKVYDFDTDSWVKAGR